MFESQVLKQEVSAVPRPVAFFFLATISDSSVKFC